MRTVCYTNVKCHSFTHLISIPSIPMSPPCTLAITSSAAHASVHSVHRCVATSFGILYASDDRIRYSVCMVELKVVVEVVDVCCADGAALALHTGLAPSELDVVFKSQYGYGSATIPSTDGWAAALGTYQRKDVQLHLHG